MPGTLLATTDLSARSDLALRRAMRLARERGARLIVAHVVDDAPPPAIAEAHRDAARATLERFLESLSDGVETELIVAFGDPTADIVALVETRRPDLLVMGTHRTRPFLDALRETTAQRIVRLTECPVLMVRDRDDHDYAHVIAATDFSPGSSAAIRLAADLSPGARITPVHAFHVPYSGLVATTPEGANEVEKSFRIEAVEQEARWRDREVLPEGLGPTTIQPGSVLQVLEAEVRRTGATLVTAGAHGRVGGIRAILGSVATDLLRMPPCDVLIARPA